jgi:hypothetical protein
MKPSLKIIISIFSGLTILTSCDPQNESLSPASATAETLDFTKYVAVGSSMVAGYTNGGLYREGQLVSYPNLIALQTGAKFEQPLFAIGQENGTGYLATTSSNTTSQFDKITDKTAIISTSPLLFAKYSGNTSNFGVASLRMSDMGKVGLGNSKSKDFNPFFERILPTGKEDMTYPDFVKESNPTFFTASIGEYDMLDFATSGGRNSLTETSVFSINCQKLLDALVANKAKGVITNLPNVLDFPYFNFNTFDEIAKNNGVAGIYITTANGIVRLATANDRILLNAIANVGKNNATGDKKGISMANPLSNDEVLDKDEISYIALRLNDFNGVIKLEAEKRGIVVVDLNSVYKQIKDNNYTAANGLKFSNSLLNGSFFSLDGINPTPRGSAVIANEVIKFINENYKNFLKTAIPTLDVSKFEALKIK